MLFQKRRRATRYILPASKAETGSTQGKPWIGLAVGISLFSNMDTQGAI
jgi:hypothetical protein